MAQYALFVDFEYCSGCYSCEVACKNAKKLPLGKWGLKLLELRPFMTDEENDRWEWDYIPVLTDLCDMCVDRIAEGKKPSCVHHCLASCMEYGTIEEMSARLAEKGKKAYVMIP